jgi:hypothetical protein
MQEGKQSNFGMATRMGDLNPGDAAVFLST